MQLKTVLGKKKNIQHKYQNTTKMLTIFLQASFCPIENFIKQEIGQENYNLLQEVKRLQIQKGTSNASF
jgi:hypothetical protein